MPRVALPACPVCRADIDRDLLPGPLTCPSCGAWLQPSPGYFKALFVIAVCLTFLVLRVAGVDGSYLLFGTVLGVWPVFLVVAALNASLFPVELEVPEQLRRPIAHRSIASLALRSFAWLLATGTVYLILQPTIVRFAPWPSRSINQGAAFPIAIRMTRTGFNIENLSERAWTCSVTVGLRSERSAALQLTSLARVHLSFDTFQGGSPSEDGGATGVMAKEAIHASCTNSSGLTLQRRF